MGKRWLLIVLLFVSFLAAGCNNGSEETISEEATVNPSAEEILLENPEADIFLLNRVIYSNATDIDWVDERELEVGEEITEITKQITGSEEFENGTATKLPVGTKIYNTTEDGNIRIAVVEGEEIPYLGLIEG